jgi:hypothetical protein
MSARFISYYDGAFTYRRTIPGPSLPEMDEIFFLLRSKGLNTIDMLFYSALSTYRYAAPRSRAWAVVAQNCTILLMEDEVPVKRARKHTERGEVAVNQTRLRFHGSYRVAPKQITTFQFQPYVANDSKLLPSVALSLFDKASQLALSTDQLICYGCEVFFCSVLLHCTAVV